MEEEEEGDDDHVCNHMIARIISNIGSHDNMPEDLDRYGLDVIWWWVLTFVTSELMAQVEINLAMGV
jgi:hypothetical protein